MCNTQHNINNSNLNSWEQNALRDITNRKDSGKELTGPQQALYDKLTAKQQGRMGKAYGWPNHMLLRTTLGFLERSPGKVLFKVGEAILQFKYTGTAYTRYPNCFHITDALNNGEYVGRLESTGTIVISAERLARFKDTLALLEKDPVQAAVAYGHAIGNCAFCARQLTDDRSVAVGYGPVCAERYGLPWGEPQELSLDDDGE
jgi:hypothetical protein